MATLQDQAVLNQLFAQAFAPINRLSEGRLALATEEMRRQQAMRDAERVFGHRQLLAQQELQGRKQLQEAELKGRKEIQESENIAAIKRAEIAAKGYFDRLDEREKQKLKSKLALFGGPRREGESEEDYFNRVFKQIGGSINERFLTASQLEEEAIGIAAEEEAKRQREIGRRAFVTIQGQLTPEQIRAVQSGGLTPEGLFAQMPDRATAASLLSQYEEAKAAADKVVPQMSLEGTAKYSNLITEAKKNREIAGRLASDEDLVGALPFIVSEPRESKAPQRSAPSIPPLPTIRSQPSAEVAPETPPTQNLFSRVVGMPSQIAENVRNRVVPQAVQDDILALQMNVVPEVLGGGRVMLPSMAAQPISDEEVATARAARDARLVFGAPQAGNRVNQLKATLGREDIFIRPETIPALKAYAIQKGLSPQAVSDMETRIRAGDMDAYRTALDLRDEMMANQTFGVP